MGGPDSLQSVKPFLENLFSDRDIIRLGPSFLQKPISSLIIKIKLKKSLSAYEVIGGRSPLTDITFQQAKALEDSLNKMSNESTPDIQRFKVFVVMRYWHPFAMEAINQIYRQGIKDLIVIPLYPQYSRATSGSSIKNLIETLANITGQDISMPQEYLLAYTIKYSSLNVRFIPSWYNHSLYIESLVDKIKDAFEFFRRSFKIKDPESEVPVLFSAHSLPQKFIEQGDPYVEQTRGTINEILKRITIKWHLSYQSKSGPVKWLEPSTEDKIIQFAKRGVKNLLVVPISFVSDHIETLYEIDILYKNIAKRHNINLHRTESLNTTPKFIEALKDIVIKNIDR